MARCFNRPLVMHEESLQALKSFYTSVNRVMPKNNEKAGPGPEGAQVLDTTLRAQPRLYPGR